MTITADLVRTALADLPPARGDMIAHGAPIAARLRSVLATALTKSAVVEVKHRAFNVEFVVANGDHWTIECLSPGSFRMYPGVLRDGTVHWANVWMRDTDMDVDELVRDINSVAFSTPLEEFQNA